MCGREDLSSRLFLCIRRSGWLVEEEVVGKEATKGIIHT